MKVHHVGYAVKDIEKALPVFSALGYEICGDIVKDNIRNVEIVFLRNGEEWVELVAPNGENTPVDGVLKNNGPTPYHICYEVEDLDKAVVELKQQKFMVLKKAEVAPAIDGCKVEFLYHKDLGMIELVEVK